MKIKIFGDDKLAGKAKDLTGYKFGNLTVVKRIGTDKERRAVYECICDCGKKTTVSAKYLKNGRKKSCGCLRGKNTYKDLTGKRFGHLLVLGRTESKNHHVKYECVCDCGNHMIADAYGLKTGQTTNCGCIPLKHGLRHTRLYAIWSDMKTRCYNSNSPNYKYYGKLGVSICEEWKNDFKSFYNWAMSNGYRDNLTIDRINPFGNYEPSNCRWATYEEQAKNKRKNFKE